MSWASTSNIAEAGTLQMEFRYLAAHTGNIDFWKIPDRAFEAIVDNSFKINKGLVPIIIGSKGNPQVTSFSGAKIRSKHCLAVHVKSTDTTVSSL